MSRNRGETDLDALRSGKPQSSLAESGPGFALFRVGDAVASRDIHAAIFDALRIMKDV